MNLNNFLLILTDDTTVFIETNADKKLTTKLLIRYALIKKFQLDNPDLTKVFNNDGYIINYLPNPTTKITDIIASKNYNIIDLTHLDQNIKDIFCLKSSSSSHSL